VTNAAGQTGAVVVARTAAAQTYLWLALGDFAGMFDKGTVTKILIKTLTTVEENLTFYSQQNERDAAVRFNSGMRVAPTWASVRAPLRASARYLPTHTCTSTHTHINTMTRTHPLIKVYSHGSKYWPVLAL
jgi:hypothetical protein